MLSRVVEFSDPPSYLLVLGHDDRHERPVTADRHLEGREKRLVLEAQMGHQFLHEESDRFIEDDVVPLARLAGGHHLVQGGLEFREFVDEILVHSDERSEGIVRRFAHRLRLPTVGVKACASRCKPRRRPREWYGVPDVLKLADPLDEALHPHAEAGVRYTPVAAGVEIPIVRLRVFSLFLEAFLDRLQVRLPLAAADELSDAVAPNHVECEDEVRAFRVPGLVEGLRDPRIVRHDDRLRLALGQRPFLQGAEVLAPLDLDAFFLESLQSLVIRHPFERRLHGLQELGGAAHRGDVVRPLLGNPLARVGDDAFSVLDHVIHARPRLLHLRMPVFRQMPRGARLSWTTPPCTMTADSMSAFCAAANAAAGTPSREIATCTIPVASRTSTNALPPTDRVR